MTESAIIEWLLGLLLVCVWIEEMHHLNRIRRKYATDEPPSIFPERVRRRGGRVSFGCWRIA
jgi:hypothetical protein